MVQNAVNTNFGRAKKEFKLPSEDSKNTKTFTQETKNRLLNVWSDNTIEILDNKNNTITYLHDTDENGKYDTKTTIKNFKHNTENLSEKTNDIKKIQQKYINEFQTEANSENQPVKKIDKNTQLDGKIDYFKQSKAVSGDCFLLGGIIALDLTDSGKTFKNNLYSKNEDVQFYSPGTKRVYKTTTNQIKRLENSLSTGDADTKAIEVAFGKHRISVLKKGDYNTNRENFLNANLHKRVGDATLENPLNGGFANEAFFFLTGKKSDTYWQPNLYDKMALKIVFKLDKEFKKDYDNQMKKDNYNIDIPLQLKQKQPQRFAQMVRFADDKKAMNTNHYYAIKEVKKDTITLINPWDTSKDVKIPTKDFKQNVKYITSCDLKKK